MAGTPTNAFGLGHMSEQDALDMLGLLGLAPNQADESAVYGIPAGMNAFADNPASKNPTNPDANTGSFSDAFSDFDLFSMQQMQNANPNTTTAHGSQFGTNGQQSSKSLSGMTVGRMNHITPDQLTTMMKDPNRHHADDSNPTGSDRIDITDDHGYVPGLIQNPQPDAHVDKPPNTAEISFGTNAPGVGNGAPADFGTNGQNGSTGSTGSTGNNGGGNGVGNGASPGGSTGSTGGATNGGSAGIGPAGVSPGAPAMGGPDVGPSAPDGVAPSTASESTPSNAPSDIGTDDNGTSGQTSEAPGEQGSVGTVGNDGSPADMGGASDFGGAPANNSDAAEGQVADNSGVSDNGTDGGDSSAA